MAIELKGKLAKLLKVTSFEIVSISDETRYDADGKADGAEYIVVEVKDEISAEGSIPLGMGSNNVTVMNKITSKEVHIAGDDVQLFLKNVVEEGDKQLYKGSMKFDVSKPKVKKGRNGEYEPASPAKLWLKSTTFARGGGEFVKTEANKRADAFKLMFGIKTEAPAAVVEEKPKVAESVKNGQPVVAKV